MLYKEANEWGEKAAAANQAASEAILAFNNEGKGDMFMISTKSSTLQYPRALRTLANGVDCFCW